ncbi:MAG: tRNA adenosine(34) deaminase TadA [Myxococcales bacterium]|nr:tRNA adenosine(34) deaminase TadA [Myxococcales bacterium]USN50012.1 MAG: nucleoside deaminase [Myxococcales bacterium]
MNHEYFMSQALKQATIARDLGEVPVGAVVVIEGSIVAQAYNRRELLSSSLEHAEISALEQACKKLGRWRLSDATLYSTLEPCVMCAGALWQSRIAQVVYGAKDSKFGGIESLYQIGADERLNHQFSCINGVLEQECAEIMTKFFADLRARKRKL